jgi:ubiquinone biosynthesis protein
MIAGWMLTHRSAPARAAIAAGEIAQTLRRLPEVLADLERALEDLATGGLRLHPETVRAVVGTRESGFGLALPIWLAALALVALAIARL